MVQLIQRASIAGANADGFTPYKAVRANARAKSLEEFLAVYPAPAIHVVDVPVRVTEASADSTLQAASLPVGLLKKEGVFRYLDEVGFLVKRPDNPFASVVSIGRAANNDLVLGLETISNVHGFFTVQGEDWFFTDNKSTNGTMVNDRQVTPSVATPVADGDRLRIGTEIVAVFLTPEALYRRSR